MKVTAVDRQKTKRQNGGNGDVEIAYRTSVMPIVVCEIHIKVIHILIQLIEKRWLNNYTCHTKLQVLVALETPAS